MNAQTHAGKINEMVSEGGGVIKEALPEDKSSQLFDDGMKVIVSLASALATRKNVLKLVKRFPVPAAIMGVGVVGLYLMNKNKNKGAVL